MAAILIVSLIVFQILLVIVHLTVYATAAVAFNIGGFWTETLFVVLALTFTTASLLVHYTKNRIAQWYYRFSAYWFGLIHFLFVGAVAFFVILNVFNWFMAYVNPAFVGGICFGILFLIHLYGTWNSGRAEILHITIPLKDLPEQWKNKTVVFVSDIHLGAVRGAAFSKKVAEKINSLNPEMVLVGGDVYDGVECDAELVVEPFKALKPPKGFYYITGNHEYYGNIERYLNAIRGAGMRIVKNEVVDIDGVQLVGVDYKDTHRREDLLRVLGAMAVDRAKPSIFLKHEPDHLETTEAAGFSVGFFGHTHQGQIYPLNYITRQMYSGFDYGLKKFGNMAVYTSSGVGTWGPPLRLGTKSEIIAILFSGAQDSRDGS